jgi:class 3 adenylate cyclase
MLVTAATALELKDAFLLDAPQEVNVKNIDEPVKVYSVSYQQEEEEEHDTGSVTPV